MVELSKIPALSARPGRPLPCRVPGSFPGLQPHGSSSSSRPSGSRSPALSPGPCFLPCSPPPPLHRRHHPPVLANNGPAQGAPGPERRGARWRRGVRCGRGRTPSKRALKPRGSSTQGLVLQSRSMRGRVLVKPTIYQRLQRSQGKGSYVGKWELNDLNPLLSRLSRDREIHFHPLQFLSGKSAGKGRGRRGGSVGRERIWLQESRGRALVAGC